VGLRLRTALVGTGLLVCAPSALARPALTVAQPSAGLGQAAAGAAQSKSSNWAGYAVHGRGASFRQVVGVWTEPNATCRRGHRTFSSYWVGLGGYNASSKALEQTGTEVDCTAAGHVRSFAWFELVPAASVHVRLKVPPGDLIQGTVTVAGQRARILLQDLTRHTAFSKVLHARVVDVSSAEWIVEAPSECVGSGRCYTLPLTDFGIAAFDGALVQPLSGQPGPISDARWSRTRIRLIEHDQAFVMSHPGLGSGGKASPSGLQSGGSAFTVSYSPLTGGSPAAGPARGLATGRLLHPGRWGFGRWGFG
jgi:hypothetical protein